MKRISIYLLGLMFSSPFFVACEKNEEAMTLDKYTVEVYLGEEAIVEIKGGKAPYKAISADKTIAEVTVEGREITIKALKKGYAIVEVFDQNGLQATMAVASTEDPYLEEKEDATARIKWDTYKKIKGTDEGTYTLTKAEDKTVTFSWTNDVGDESLVLSFKDTEDQIGGTKEVKNVSVRGENETRGTRMTVIVEPAGKLTVTERGKDPVNYDVFSWKLVQIQPADDEEGPDIYWIGFSLYGKLGICVAPLTAETK